MPGWAGHHHTASRMWCWRPPASTAFPLLQRRQAAQGPRGAEMPQHAHMGAEWYPGSHSPPACPAELPMYAKDIWPNGLPLPHRLHMEWRGWKSPSSEYWSDALIGTWIWIYQGRGFGMSRLRFCRCRLSTKHWEANKEMSILIRVKEHFWQLQTGEVILCKNRLFCLLPVGCCTIPAFLLCKCGVTLHLSAVAITWPVWSMSASLQAVRSLQWLTAISDYTIAISGTI